MLIFEFCLCPLCFIRLAWCVRLRCLLETNERPPGDQYVNKTGPYVPENACKMVVSSLHQIHKSFSMNKCVAIDCFKDQHNQSLLIVYCSFPAGSIFRGSVNSFFTRAELLLLSAFCGSGM